MQGRKDYQEKLFVRFQLSDYVPQENFYRRLKSTIDFDFLYASTAGYYGREGQKSIDPVVFMKLMLVGYLENLNSDRRIITSSRMRMDILYFIGYDLDEELPWHSTLSRTRQLYGQDQFMALFKVVLKQCVSKGLILGKRQAIDSVLVKANAAMSSMIEREVLADAAAYGRELDSNMDDQTKSTDTLPEGKMPKNNAGPIKPAKPSNKTYVSPSDPDARMSYKPGKVTRLNYLAQISVDTSHHVITHIQAFHSDKGDSQCFEQVLASTIENLRENCLQLKEVLADAGYSSAAALQALDRYNIIGYIPNAAGYKPDRKGFVYDHENDRYLCPQGAYLTLRRIRNKDSNTYKVYKTGVKDCRPCPFLLSCANPAGIRVIEDALTKSLNDQMHVRMQSEQGRQMRRLRHSTVEPVLGTLVNFTAMDKVYTKGIGLANKAMIMAAVAYNIKKLIRFISAKTARQFSKSAHALFLRASKPVVPKIVSRHLQLIPDCPKS